MRYDMIGVWTAVSVRELEDALQRELGGEFVDYPNGRRSLLFGDVPGEAKVRVPRAAGLDSFPNVVIHIDDRDEGRSIDVQRDVAMAVFDAVVRVTRDRVELWAEDDRVVKQRPAYRAA